MKPCGGIRVAIPPYPIISFSNISRKSIQQTGNNCGTVSTPEYSRIIFEPCRSGMLFMPDKPCFLYNRLLVLLICSDHRTPQCRATKRCCPTYAKIYRRYRTHFSYNLMYTGLNITGRHCYAIPSCINTGRHLFFRGFDLSAPKIIMRTNAVRCKSVTR
jgi:hypothetical protein